MGKRNRKFSDEWYEHGRNPFPHLKEWWYQQYVKEHPEEFGFTKLDGPFSTGPDLLGVIEGRRGKERQLRVEVEREYLTYRQHGHPPSYADLLIVGVLDAPLPSMLSFLPPAVKNLDPNKVFEWSKPKREAYREEIARRLETVPQQLEWIRENVGPIRTYWIVSGTVRYIPEKIYPCEECGSPMKEWDDGEFSILESDDGPFYPMIDPMTGFKMSDDQIMSHMFGNNRLFYCGNCNIFDHRDVPFYDGEI